MTIVSSKENEKKVEEIKEAVRGILNVSPNEVTAIVKINQLEGANVSGSSSNPTGSFTFRIKINLPGENRPRVVPLTTRFRR